jgi:hypothetical protein
VKRGLRFAALLCLCAGAAYAGDATHGRLLLTIADPGLANAVPAGPARPGYGRRSADYLIGIDVRRAADRVARDFELRIVDEWPITALKVHCLVLEFDGGRDVEKLLADLRKRPEVESVQPIHEFEVLGEPVAGTDPFVGLQHNLEELELVEAHGWSRGAGSRVTIIDTGADIEHPELAPQVVEHADFVSDAGEVFAADAHGTAVAGIIGAVEGNGVGIVGVAPSARLSVLRACWYEEDESGGGAVCDSFTLAKALAHAIDTAPQIINLSLGGPSDPLLSRLLLIAMDRGAIVIAADAGDSEPGFPAGVPGVIVVGSTAGQNALPAVQVLAPGDEILVPTPGGGYDYSSGSSLSAAQVSGIAALLLAMRPALSGADVDRLLLDSRGGGQDYVNACRALARLLGRAGCRDAAADAGRDRTASEAGGQAQYEL